MTPNDKALALFHQWNDVTGAITPDTGWFYELESIIKDAVKIGQLTEKGSHFYIENGKLHEEPSTVIEARQLIKRLTSDMGFMGSPAYYEAKQIVDAYWHPILEKEEQEKERELYEKLKAKFDVNPLSHQ